mgnify:CR=1 FL=1
MLFSLLLQFSDLAERHFLEKVEFFEESAESIVEIGRAHRAVVVCSTDTAECKQVQERYSSAFGRRFRTELEHD